MCFSDGMVPILIIIVLSFLDVVPILTSTVIECQKAGLKMAGFGYAAMLLRPEYREKLDPKHRRKFETLIRRPDRKPNNEVSVGGADEDVTGVEGEALTPCPSCSHPLLASVLYCTECRSTLPYCVITVGETCCRLFSIFPIWTLVLSFMSSSEGNSSFQFYCRFTWVFCYWVYLCSCFVRRDKSTSWTSLVLVFHVSW